MILIEEHFDTVKPIEEATQSGDKKLYLEGVFGEAETANRNKRIYESTDMKTAVSKINEAAESGRHILGHLDHPDGSLEIKLEDVSHRLMSASMDGNQMRCKAEILDKHPKGAIAKGLVESGVNVGVSTRGSGSVSESSGRVKNYNFATVDLVATPSCSNAYPETLREQMEMYGRGGVLNDLAEAQIHDPLAQQYFRNEMDKFIRSLGLND